MPQYFFPPGTPGNTPAIAVEVAALSYLGYSMIGRKSLGEYSKVLVPVVIGGTYYWYWKWVRDPKRIAASMPANKMVAISKDANLSDVKLGFAGLAEREDQDRNFLRTFNSVGNTRADITVGGDPILPTKQTFIEGKTIAPISNDTPIGITKLQPYHAANLPIINLTNAVDTLSRPRVSDAIGSLRESGIASAITAINRPTMYR